jgi:hypothetical protein
MISLHIPSSYGGEVATMQLNIAFRDAGVPKGNLDLPFGNIAAGQSLFPCQFRLLIWRRTIHVGGGYGAAAIPRCIGDSHRDRGEPGNGADVSEQ